MECAIPHIERLRWTNTRQCTLWAIRTLFSCHLRHSCKFNAVFSFIEETQFTFQARAEWLQWPDGRWVWVLQHLRNIEVFVMIRASHYVEHVTFQGTSYTLDDSEHRTSLSGEITDYEGSRRKEHDWSASRGISSSLFLICGYDNGKVGRGHRCSRFHYAKKDNLEPLYIWNPLLSDSNSCQYSCKKWIHVFSISQSDT